MNGKSKCKILKDIRRQIAQDNDIDYVTSECKYQGDCAGTCPKCEAELRYLEEELQKRQKAGKAIAVAGIAATLVVSTAACAPSQRPGLELQGDMPVETVPSESTAPTGELIDGDIVIETDPTESTDLEVVGMLTVEDELFGDPVP